MIETKPTTLPHNETINKQRAFWASIIFTVVALTSFVFSLIMARSSQTWQMDVITAISAVALIVDIISLALIVSGRLELGLKYLFWSTPFTVAPNVLLVSGTTPILIAMVLIVGYVNVFYLQPRSWRKVNQFVPIITSVIMALIELFQPAFRINPADQNTASGNFGPFILAFLVISLFALLVRQAVLGNIRSKLSTFFMLIAIFSVLAVAYPANQLLISSLTTIIGNNLDELANARGVDIGQTIGSELKALKVLALNPVIQNAAAAANQERPLSQAEIDRLDQQWRAADAADNSSVPLVAGVLNNDVAAELRNFRDVFPQQVELFLTDIQGLSIASTNRTSDYLQSDEEWWQTAYRDGIYLGQPEYDESSKTIAMNMAVAVRENGNTVGVLRTTVNFTTLTDTLIAGLFGTTGRTNIYLPDGSEFTLDATGSGSYDLVQQAAPPDIQTLVQSTEKYQTIVIDEVSTLASYANVTMPENAGMDAQIINNLNWHVVTLQDEAEARQPVSAQTRNISIFATISIIIGAFAGRYLASVISNPILRLKVIAEKVATGDLTATARVENRDEIGTLATTFNSMVAQLREMVGTLEQRVADRTKDLATVAEVSTATATIQKTDLLLQEVVDLTKERFNLYHSHIYLLDEIGRNLVLAAGAGEPGRIMVSEGRSIPLDREQSLVARAARERRGVTVNDVTQASDFLPNPLLPDTRSELAVPMIVSGNVIGVFDIQSDQVGRFTDSDVNIQTTLASQLATSIQNVRSFEQSKKQAELQSLVNVIGSRIQRTTSIEETLQTAIRELGTAISASRVKASIEQPIREN